jgi:hypothetical protein
VDQIWIESTGNWSVVTVEYYCYVLFRKSGGPLSEAGGLEDADDRSARLLIIIKHEEELVPGTFSISTHLSRHRDRIAAQFCLSRIAI